MGSCLMDSLKPSSSSRSFILSKDVRSNQPFIRMPMFRVMGLCTHKGNQVHKLGTQLHCYSQR